MIINARASSSVNFGDYLTNRDTLAYTIIEGNPKRIDMVATNLLKDNPRKKNSHYSYVLSFKEEDLTKDQLLDYYEQFKNDMFKNYANEELEILSVIHWDDNKPHIHCTVINGSQIDKDRDLRLYRGIADFKRIEAIQEKINYKNDLSSIHDNYNLLSLTKEQKERDWKIKKRNYKPYRVFDDDVFEYIEESIKNVGNFEEFMGKIESKFGKTLIKNTSELNKDDGFTKSSLLKECRLVLLDHNKSKLNNYTYKSKLFDKKWFNSNLGKLQQGLEKASLKNIRYSKKRKTLSEYEKIEKETSNKHNEHLWDRKVGLDWTKQNVDVVLRNGLRYILDMNYAMNSLSAIEGKFERFLSFANKQYIEEFIDRFGRDNLKYKDDRIVLSLGDGININLFNDNLIAAFTDNEESMDFEYKDNDLFALVENINKSGNRTKARLLIEDLVVNNEIRNKEELVNMLSYYGLSVTRSAEDKFKGKYLTLESESGDKLSLYNDVVSSIYSGIELEADNKNGFKDVDSYKKKRDQVVLSDIENNFIDTLIKNVYRKNNGKLSEHHINIDCVNDYKIYYKEPLDNVCFMIDDKKSGELKITSNNTYEKLSQIGKDGVRIDKTLDEYKTGQNLADMYFLQGHENIYMNKNISDEMKRGIIDRINQSGYNLSLFNHETSSLIFTPKYENIKDEWKPVVEKQTDISSVEKEVGSNIDTDKLTKEVQNSIDEDGGLKEILKTIDRFNDININSLIGVEEFRSLILDIAANQSNSMTALLSVNGVEVLRNGHDSKKGDYVTFSFKGKKVAVYDDKIKDNFEFDKKENVYVLK